MTELACPACGESEKLSGAPRDGGIELTCGRCGERWARGTRGCKGCGGTEHIDGSQRMTTYPRGNQLSVIGRRIVPLCPQCDARIIAEIGPTAVLPESYASRFLYGHPAPPALGQPKPRPSRPPQRDERRAAAPQRPRPTAPDAPAAKKIPDDPTVRLAMDAFLSQAAGAADLGAMLVLGTALGSPTRLSSLRSSDAATAIAAAMDRHYGRKAGRRADAAAAIDTAFTWWRDQGWITSAQIPELSESG